MPIVRTFITAVAGNQQDEPRKYFLYSALGGVVWAVVVPLLGFFLGQVPLVHDHLEMFLVAIPVLSVIPIVFEVIKGPASASAREPPRAARPMDATQQFDMRGEDLDVHPAHRPHPLRHPRPREWLA